MESKFEILSYQNCNDLKKAINPSSVLIGAVTLLLGLYLAIFVSVSDPTSNLNMLRLAAGWVLAGFGLVTLVFNPRRWVYDPTGSPVGKRSLDFGMEQLPPKSGCRKMLLEGTRVSRNLVGINFRHPNVMPNFAVWKTITYRHWHRWCCQPRF